MQTKKVNALFEKIETQISLSSTELGVLKEHISLFSKKIENPLKEINKKIYIFLGGSLAKGTVIRKKERYDIDLFVVFPKEFKEKSQEISGLLEKAIKKTGEKYQRLNGSRDYFQIKKENLILELVPIIKINKSEGAMNITDISPLHVMYLLKKIKSNPKLPKEIILAKTFSYAQRVYGAESYIGGFSGYSIEILTSYFGSFQKLIDFFSKINLNKKNNKKNKHQDKNQNKIVIDPEKYYKNKNELLMNLNESKIISPLILIDPVDKTRNVSAALSVEKFREFIEACKKFNKNPNPQFFIFKEKSEQDLKNKINKIRLKPKVKAELIKIRVETEKDKLDVAGAKINKFFNYILRDLEKNGFTILQKENFFDEETMISNIYFILKNPEKLKIVPGPIVDCNEKFIKEFKKKYKKTFIKNKRHFAKTQNEFSNFNDFFKFFRKKNADFLKLMSIKSLALEKI